MLPLLRSGIIFVVALIAAWCFASLVSRGYPIGDWLFVDLIRIYGWELLLTAACASVGHLVLTRVLRLRDLSGLATLALSLPVGLVAFVLLMFAGGYLALYGKTFAVAVPLVLLAIGLPAGVRAVRAARRPSFLIDGVALVAILYGTLGVILTYIQILSPDSLNYDATWTHLVIAQDYARERRIVPFTANWNCNVPHLASLVYAWCFLVPGSAIDHPLRWMLALHTEYNVFLWTLLGVSAAVAWLAPPRVRGSWAAYFLFPGIFVYDGNLGGAADHFLALFAAPLFLAAVCAARRFEAGFCALVGILTAGAIATKAQGIFLIAPIGMMLGGRLAYLAYHRMRGRQDVPEVSSMLRGMLLLVGCAIVCACPQFIENWVYFHNPVYPLMQRTFTHSSPTMPGAAEMFDSLFADWHWHPPKEFGERLWQALRLAFMFSFEPHTYFGDDRPYFGSIFTLLVPVMAFLPSARRLWVGLFVGMGALFTWAFTYWLDRNLHTFLPILVAVTGATIVRTWRLGGAGRLGILALVGLHLIWSVDWIFSGHDRLQAGVALIKSGLDRRTATRYSDYRQDYRQLGHAIPENGLAILHNWHVSLGINRRILLDWMGLQGLIDYRPLKTPRQAYDRFVALGVTHLIALPGTRSGLSRQEQIIFDTLVGFYAVPVGHFGGLALYEMPHRPPPQQAPFRVLVMGIGGYANGVYPVERLTTLDDLPSELRTYAAPDVALRDLADLPFAIATVDAALIGSSIKLESSQLEMVGRTFRPIATYNGFTAYARAPAELP